MACCPGALQWTHLPCGPFVDVGVVFVCVSVWFIRFHSQPQRTTPININNINNAHAPATRPG